MARLITFKAEDHRITGTRFEVRKGQGRSLLEAVCPFRVISAFRSGGSGITTRGTVREAITAKDAKGAK